MTSVNNINPPPLQIPPQLAADKLSGAFFSGLIQMLNQMWLSLYGLRITTTAKTTDNTVTGAVRIPIKEGNTIMVVAHIVGRRTGGSSGAVGDSAWYQLMGAYKNIGGVLTGIGTPNLFGGEDQAAWDVSFSSSGSEIVVAVQGATGNDVTWKVTVSTYDVGA